MRVSDSEHAITWPGIWVRELEKAMASGGQVICPNKRTISARCLERCNDAHSWQRTFARTKDLMVSIEYIQTQKKDSLGVHLPKSQLMILSAV